MKKKFSIIDNSLKKILLDSISSFVIVLIIIILLYKVYSYAPFGGNSLACNDANIQYLDFFSYLKDILTGNNSIGMTFSKCLGGNSIGIYAYYLASPFNLLVLLFNKADLNIFFNLVVALKLATAAFTFCIFLHGRFSMYIDNTYKRMLIIMLSLSYALCQYNITQCSNIMWLDGVYMLPLLLLEIHNVVYYKLTWKLPILVGLSIFFNWYSAGINCLFSFFWVCFETSMLLCEKKYEKNFSLKITIYKIFLRYTILMIVGLFISMVLFLPTIMAMNGNSKGTVSFGELSNLLFIGQLPSLIQNYSLGAESSYGSVSLYCGSFALIGCIASLISETIQKKIKIIFGVAFSIIILLFYWNPFCFVFSLFKPVSSYWYRYSYIGIFFILFLASYYYIIDIMKSSTICKIGILFAGILIIFDYLKSSQDSKLTYYTAILSICVAITLAYTLYSTKKSFLLIFLILFELSYETQIQMKDYHISDVTTYEKYIKDMEEKINYIQRIDNAEPYRISQTSTRNFNQTVQRTANYNESLAFGYASISSYTSVPDDIQLNLLDRLGYRLENECTTIVNTSILAADSLLGVKYILSDYPITGLAEENMSFEEEKKIFRNPYSLPFAFAYSDAVFNCENFSNPFEYQNALYSQLIGEKLELYKPLDFTITRENGLLTYHISTPSENYPVYGNIPGKSSSDAIVNINNVYNILHAQWLSPSVFYIPAENGTETSLMTLQISSSNYDYINYGEEQFYVLDLNVLDLVSQKLNLQKASYIYIKNGFAKFEITADQNENLYISIPYDKGWKIKKNGVTSPFNLFADCMYSIPLDKGTNTIEMTYEIPGLKTGAFITGIGILLNIIIFLKGRKKDGTKNEYYA